MKNKGWILIGILVLIILAFVSYKLYTTSYYDKVKPKQITFYGSDRVVSANTGAYSWSKNILGQTLHVNACGIGPLEMEYKDILKIVKGTSVKSDLPYNVTKITVYKYDGKEPKIIENNLKYDKENQTIDMSDLEVGVYIIEVFAEEGNNNDVIYSFKLEILDSIN